MLRALLVLLVHKECPARLALKDRPDHKDLPVLKDRKEIRGLV